MKNRTLRGLQASYRRAIILRFLSEDFDHSIDTELLRAALRTVSYGVPRAQVHEDAAWLERHGLVSREDVGGALIMKITRRGLDVVAGDGVVEGVERSCLEA